MLANESKQDAAGDASRLSKTKYPQWFFKITDYADQLIEDLDQIIVGPSRRCSATGLAAAKALSSICQSSHDACMRFTTRVDTVYGMSFAVLAPGHPLVRSSLPGKR